MLVEFLLQVISQCLVAPGLLACLTQFLAKDEDTGGELTGFPSGAVVVWPSTIASIPAGWVICDGNNSTLNLLTKFLQGVATAATDPGATGGAATHTLIASEAPAHTHTLYSHSSGSGENAVGFINDDAGTMTMTGMWTSSEGGGGAHNNEPAYYDVAYDGSSTASVRGVPSGSRPTAVGRVRRPPYS